MTGTVRVVLADDQALVRSGFAMVLSVEEDIQVVGQAANGQQVLSLLEQEPADIVLMDVQMPVMDGIAATREVVARGLAKVIVLTTFDREDYLFDGLAAGASGFLLKNADPDDLVDAIRAVADGHALLAPEVTLRVISRLTGDDGGLPSSAHHPATPAPGAARKADAASHRTGAGGPAGTTAGEPAGRPGHELRRAVASLTPREREILARLAEGLSNAEIAAQLFLGEATVKTHVSNVLAKTGSRDRVQAVVFAYRAGLTGRS